MTRFVHDQFSKGYLEELLSPYGYCWRMVAIASSVRAETVWIFLPGDAKKAIAPANFPQNKCQLFATRLSG